MSRFILGLLSISLDEGRSQLRTSQWKTLHFTTIAQTFAGDVGVLDEKLLDNDGLGEVDDLVDSESTDGTQGAGVRDSMDGCEA